MEVKRTGFLAEKMSKRVPDETLESGKNKVSTDHEPELAPQHQQGKDLPKASESLSRRK
jgi:hypothetical protein